MKFSDVLIIQCGEALGHGFHVDEKTLDTVVSSAPAEGIPVRLDHSSSTHSIVGVAKGFRRVADRVVAEISLFKGAALYDHAVSLIRDIPKHVGMSIIASGQLEAVGELSVWRVGKLFAADVVQWPAATRGGMFGLSALSADGTGLVRLATAEPAKQVTALTGIRKAAALLGEKTSQKDHGAPPADVALLTGTVGAGARLEWRQNGKLSKASLNAIATRKKLSK